MFSVYISANVYSVDARCCCRHDLCARADPKGSVVEDWLCKHIEPKFAVRTTRVLRVFFFLCRHPALSTTNQWELCFCLSIRVLSPFTYFCLLGFHALSILSFVLFFLPPSHKWIPVQSALVEMFPVMVTSKNKFLQERMQSCKVLACKLLC